MAKIGLYFGSFNPIHLGHLAIAGYMTEFTPLEQVWFVVSPHNPLKKKETLLEDHQRLYMAQLAIGDNDRLKATDIEFKLPSPSYTINTLAYLEEKYPQHIFNLVLGEDNLYTFHKWKNADYILKNYKLYVYPRPGIDCSDFINDEHIEILEAPLMELSSTFIRKAVKDKKDIRFYMPEREWNYLKEMHFYEK